MHKNPWESYVIVFHIFKTLSCISLSMKLSFAFCVYFVIASKKYLSLFKQDISQGASTKTWEYFNKIWPWIGRGGGGGYSDHPDEILKILEENLSLVKYRWYMNPTNAKLLVKVLLKNNLCSHSKNTLIFDLETQTHPYSVVIFLFLGVQASNRFCTWQHVLMLCFFFLELSVETLEQPHFCVTSV